MSTSTCKPNKPAPNGFLAGEPFPNFRSPFRTYLLCLAYLLGLLFILRLAFLIFIHGSLDGVSISETIKALYIGFRFDARIAAIITLPVGICLTIPALTRAMPKQAKLVGGFYFAVFLVLITTYISDFGHYSYLGIRINAYVFDLLRDFEVAALMVWQSYHVIPLLLLLLVSSFACTLIMWRIIRRVRPSKSTRPKAAMAWLAAFLIFALAAYGQLTSNLFPLRWSNAYFSSNPAVNALAINPLQNLYDTYRSTLGGGFNLEAVKKYYPLMCGILKVDSPNPETLTYLRHTAATPPAPGKRPPNVVVIVMESLSFPKTSFAPGDLDPTPELLKLSKESVLYPHFYAPTRTTARAVFTTLTGIPDVNQDGNTSSRNPFLVDQRVILNEFKDYRKIYMLGGSTSWANIRGVFSANVDNLEIMEESSWKSPNMDVWGVSDLDLLREANGVLENITDQPFFAFIQLASFHRPYTIPNNALEAGFKVLPITKEQKANYGFVGDDEYNSLRFSDFAVGEFFRLAKQSSYYSNTIFFIFGDHGLSDLGKNMPASYWATDLHSYHVPLIIHAPGRLQPGVEKMTCTQLDIFPTAAKMAGIEFNNYTLGRDLFDTSFNDSRFAFVAGAGTTPIRLAQGDFCYYDNRQGERVLYNLLDNEKKDYSAEKPEIFAKLEELANAMNETSRYMLNNNGKDKKY